MDDFERWREEALEEYVRERDAEGRRANRGCVLTFLAVIVFLAVAVAIVAAVAR